MTTRRWRGLTVMCAMLLLVGYGVHHWWATRHVRIWAPLQSNPLRDRLSTEVQGTCAEFKAMHSKNRITQASAIVWALARLEEPGTVSSDEYFRLWEPENRITVSEVVDLLGEPDLSTRENPINLRKAHVLRYDCGRRADRNLPQRMWFFIDKDTSTVVEIWFKSDSDWRLR